MTCAFVTLSNRLGKQYVSEGIVSGKAYIYMENGIIFDITGCFFYHYQRRWNMHTGVFFSAISTLAEDHVVVSSPGDHNYAKECASPPRMIFNITFM